VLSLLLSLCLLSLLLSLCLLSLLLSLCLLSLLLPILSLILPGFLDLFNRSILINGGSILLDELKNIHA
jgi:hypothetical protein